MKVLLKLFIVILAIHQSVIAQDINVIPSAPLAFAFPCGNDPKWFVQSYQVQENNNNWEGIFYMDKFTNVFSVRLQMYLENPATVTLKNTLGNVISNDNQTFTISTFKIPPEIRRIEFKVKGLSQGYFPHLISLKFNESPLCDNSERDLSAPFLKKSKSCGKVQIGRHQGLIANSYDASPGSWPWHVAIYHIKQNGQPVYKCGGTLIDSKVVLTAAHCMFGDDGGVVRESQYLIHMGKHGLNTVDEHTKEFKVERATLHQSYQKKTYANDIGLLKLNGNVQFTKYIQPICLWDELPNQRVYFQTGYVVGWGFTEQGNVPAEILREAQMPVVETAQCLDSNREVFGEFLSPTNFCAGYRNGTSVCSGDSGSGMFVNLNGLWKIRGLVSLGVKAKQEASCNPNDYVLFTDVLKYIDWIKERLDQ